MATFSREVSLTARHMATMASTEADPETMMMRAEEGREDGEDPDAPKITKKLQVVMAKFLPAEESFLLEACFLHGQSQSAIADRLGVIEQSIQHRIGRALERVRWALQLKTWNRTPRAIRRALGSALTPSDTRFAVALWHCRWNQSRTAWWIGSTQSRVRIRIMHLHESLKDSAHDRKVAPFLWDLTKVIDAKAWCAGTAQVQGQRAVKWASQAPVSQLALPWGGQ
jgi:hypothetical protein